MSRALLIKDVRIFDGEVEIPNGDVLVEDGIIKKVSVTPLNAANESTTVVSKPGHTLIPGLIDGHVHAHADGAFVLTQSLKFGVTTVCDLHIEPEFMLGLKKQAAEDPDAADFKMAGQAATVEGGWPGAIVLAINNSEKTRAQIDSWPKLKTSADVEPFIQDRLRDKVDFIKLMHEDGLGMRVKPKPAVPSLELQKQIVQAAHSHGLLAIAHATSLQSTIDVLEAGVDGLTHSVFDQKPTQELIAAYKKNNAYCNPVLVTTGSITSQGQKEQETYAHDPRVQKFLSQKEREKMCKCIGLGNEDADVEYSYESVRQLKAAGIDIIMGSAAGLAPGTAVGLTAHQEMAVFVRKCGFTPAEAIRSATALVAKRLQFPDRGRIAKGLRADLVLIDGNPLENIDQTLNIRAVWKKGEICSVYGGILKT